jgi:hypothetical protein
MILLHINLSFFPTNWYILIHINLCHKKEIESWRYLLPSWLLHCLSPSSRCATLLSCTVNCRRPCHCPVHRLPPLRSAPPQPPRCCHRAAAAALCATAALPLTPHRRQASATAAAAATILPVVGWLLHCCPPTDFVIACHHATINALIDGVNIFVQIRMYSFGQHPI